MPTSTSITALGKAYFHRSFPLLTRALGGDNCASGIVSVLDFLTLSKKESLHAAGENEGRLWVEITLSRLADMMDNVYSVRRLQERLEILVDVGLIVTPDGQKIYIREVDKKLYFLLNSDGVSSLIESGKPLILKAADICRQKHKGSCGSEANTRDPLTNVGQPLTNVGGGFSENPSNSNNQKALLNGDEIALSFRFKTLDKEHILPTPNTSKTNTSEPISPILTGKCLSSKFKQLPHGKAGAEVSEIIVRRLGEVAADYSEEQVLEAFDGFAAETFWLEYDPKHRVRAFFKYLTDAPQNGNSAAHAPAPVFAGPRQDGEAYPAAAAAPQAPQIDFVARWNELIPEAPVDPALMAKSPRPYRDPLFAARFDEICQKARALIQAGADLKFGFLLRAETGTERYRWQALLADELNWMKPRAKSAKQQGEDFVERKLRELHERKAATNRA